MKYLGFCLVFAICGLAGATNFCSTQTVPVQRVQKVVQPVKQRAVRQQVVRQQVVREDPQIVEEQIIVEGDNSEVLFFVSPEYRSSQLYPQRQEQVVNSELLQAVKELRQLILDMRNQPVRQTVQPQVMSSPPPTTGVVRTNCVWGVNGQACHGGASPASSFSLEGNLTISDEMFRKSLEQIVVGDMPKDHELDQMTKNRILIELLSRK